MKELIAIGFWRSKDEPFWPDPAKFIDVSWDKKERLIVSRYLKTAQVLSASPGSSWCRFRCKSKYAGSATYTDGHFVWPEGLSHYVDTHFVKLPDEFIKHVIRNEKSHVGPPYEQIVFDKEWWINQNGWSNNESFLTPSFYGEMWAVMPVERVSSDTIKFFRRFDCFSTKSTAELRDILKSGDKFLLSDKFAYCDFIEVNEEAAKLGIQLNYIERY